jgi:hypothetical protein
VILDLPSHTRQHTRYHTCYCELPQSHLLLSLCFSLFSVSLHHSLYILSAPSHLAFCVCSVTGSLPLLACFIWPSLSQRRLLSHTLFFSRPLHYSGLF